MTEKEDKIEEFGLFNIGCCIVFCCCKVWWRGLPAHDAFSCSLLFVVEKRLAGNDGLLKMLLVVVL